MSLDLSISTAARTTRAKREKSSGSSHIGSISWLYSQRWEGLCAGWTVTLCAVVVDADVDGGCNLVGDTHGFEMSIKTESALVLVESREVDDDKNDVKGCLFFLVGAFAVVGVGVGAWFVVLAIAKVQKECSRSSSA